MHNYPANICWAGSFVLLVLSFIINDVDFGHAGLWLGMVALVLSVHQLSQTVISRLTQVMAMFNDDVHLDLPTLRVIPRHSNGDDEDEAEDA